LLQAQDQVAGMDTIPFTQEFLSNMLGVRRSTVTVAASALQEAGSIRYSRGRIHIVDRPLLEETSCECYVAISAAARLLVDRKSRHSA
jgi:hypothetical protein